MSLFFFRVRAEDFTPSRRLTHSAWVGLAVFLALGLGATAVTWCYRWWNTPKVYGLPASTRPITTVGIPYLAYRVRVAPALQVPTCQTNAVARLELASASEVRRELARYTTMTAVYLPGTDTVFAPLGTANTTLQVLAHERAHAIQDQHIAIDSLFAARTTTDGRAAARAQLEGVAVLASDTSAGHQEAQYGDDLLVNWNRLMYIQAPAVVRAARERDGRDLLTQTVMPPTSTWAFLFPGVPLADYARPLAPVLNAEAEIECDDELGPLAIYTAAYRHTQSHRVASRAALAWRGDRVTLYRLQGQSFARWDVSFAAGTPNLTTRWREWYPASPAPVPVPAVLSILGADPSSAIASPSLSSGADPRP